MLKANLVAVSNIDEYEVTLEIQGNKLICFAVVCPFKINVGASYLIELLLKTSEKSEPRELNYQEYSFEKIGKGCGYILHGLLERDRLSFGSFFIQDDYLKQFPKLNGKYVELIVEGLWVTFLSSCE